jgi:uncharacterized protein YciI
MWYICLRRGLRPPEKFNVGLDEHLVWMRAQHESGRILMSGPSPSRKLGIYIIKADSDEEAARIAATDPFTVAGDTEYELIDWDVRQILGAGPFTLADIKAQTSSAEVKR